MKKLTTIIAIATILTACGGGEPDLAPAPQAQAAAACRYALVVHGTTLAPADACTVISHATTAAQLEADVDAARGTMERAYIVATGPGADLALALGAMATGKVDGASLWLGQFDPATDLHGSIVTWRLNGACDALATGLRARHTPAYCAGATAFDPAAAIAQLGV